MSDAKSQPGDQVALWEAGNGNYGPWETGNHPGPHTPASYAQNAVPFFQAMHQARLGMLSSGTGGEPAAGTPLPAYYGYALASLLTAPGARLPALNTSSPTVTAFASRAARIQRRSPHSAPQPHSAPRLHSAPRPANCRCPLLTSVPYSFRPGGGGAVLIDCDRCVMRDIACADCVVGALMADRGRPDAGPPGEQAGCDADHGHNAPGPEIGEPERRALRTLADAGLVPPLRLALPGAAPEEPAGEFPDTRFPDADASFPDAEAS